MVGGEERGGGPEAAAAGARTVRLVLNSQQLELVDRTVAGGAASDRIALVRRALRELAAAKAAAAAAAEVAR